MANLYLPNEWKELVELLNRKNVKYIIVGGVAVTFHGYPRFTGDIDFWVAVSKENAEKIVECINEFGFGSMHLKPEDFLEEDIVLQLGRQPLRIDFLTSLTGLVFEECYPKAIHTVYDNLPMVFIDKESLLKNKIATGRPRDLGDAEELK